jgi:predicted lipoprotein with Yx(FWY)xxD motif
MRPTLKILFPSLAVSLTLAACGSSSNGSSSSAPASTASTSSAATAAVVKTASNATLGSTVLVDPQGKTLYHLSGEQDGKFLCTSAACVANWPPVSATATSAAIAGLEAVKRPDGTEQLAYKDEPLYTFAGDKAAGEANGQGVKADGGTWSAVVAATGSTSAPQTTSTSEPASKAY